MAEYGVIHSTGLAILAAPQHSSLQLLRLLTCFGSSVFFQSGESRDFSLTHLVATS